MSRSVITPSKVRVCRSRTTGIIPTSCLCMSSAVSCRLADAATTNGFAVIRSLAIMVLFSSVRMKTQGRSRRGRPMSVEDVHHAGFVIEDVCGSLAVRRCAHVMQRKRRDIRAAQEGRQEARLVLIVQDCDARAIEDRLVEIMVAHGTSRESGELPDPESGHSAQRN